MFSSIKNAQLVKKPIIYLKKQKQCEKFLTLLWNEGFILGYKLYFKKIKIFLKYSKNKPVINCLKIVSKPSRKIYFSASQLWKINSKNFYIIISTNCGLYSLLECKKQNVGGEILIILN